MRNERMHGDGSRMICTPCCSAARSPARRPRPSPLLNQHRAASRLRARPDPMAMTIGPAEPGDEDELLSAINTTLLVDVTRCSRVSRNTRLDGTRLLWRRSTNRRRRATMPRRLFRSFLKKAAPKTSVILKRTFETVCKCVGQGFQKQASHRYLAYLANYPKRLSGLYNRIKGGIWRYPPGKSYP